MVQVLGRAATVLACFDYQHPELGVTEIAGRVQLPTSTTHRLLASLQAIGFVERSERGRYRLGLTLHELGLAATFGMALRQRGHRHLEDLRARTGHTAHLAVLSGADIVYVERLEDPRVFGRFARSGWRVPAYASSSGKALLAFGGSELSMQAIARSGFTRRAPRTITAMPALLEELERTRQRGYAESVEETWPDMGSVAAPVLDVAGKAVASLSVAGPLGEFDGEARTHAARLVVKAARTLGAELVAHQPERPDRATAASEVQPTRRR
jgi:IclR family transcriptional regulator, acetate operon repressor